MKENLMNHSKLYEILKQGVCWSIIVLITSVLILSIMSCQKEKQKEILPFLIIAHRGASRAAPENTLAAMKKAMEFGADFAELDACQTKDDTIVLMHDEKLERTTGQQGLIWEYALTELKEFEAGSWFSEEFRGEPIPTLQEVMHLVRGKMKLNIEIKVFGHEPGIAQKVVDIIRGGNFENECMVTSFDRKTVEEVKNIAPELMTGFIFDEDYQGNVFDGNWDVLSCDRQILDEELIKKAKDSGKKIFVWTVNDPREMKKLIDLKVDGLITDVPDVLKDILDRT
jgi:glycerophosphoryl diester phosphodiesterase